MPPKLGPARGRTLRSLGALSAVGLSFVMAVVIGAAIGYALDRWLGTSPWLFLICFFLGSGGGHARRLPNCCRHVPGGRVR